MQKKNWGDDEETEQSNLITDLNNTKEETKQPKKSNIIYFPTEQSRRKTVAKYIPPNQRNSNYVKPEYEDKKEENTTIFIKNLPLDSSRKDVFELCRAAVKSIPDKQPIKKLNYICTRDEKKEFRGFIYCTFNTLEQAELAVTKLHKYIYGKLVLWCEIAQKQLP